MPKEWISIIFSRQISKTQESTLYSNILQACVNPIKGHFFDMAHIMNCQFFFVSSSDLQLRVRNWKWFFLFLKQNICCGYSKEPSRWDGSFEHPKHKFKLMGKNIFTILRSKILLIQTCGTVNSFLYPAESKQLSVKKGLKIILFSPWQGPMLN